MHRWRAQRLGLEVQDVRAVATPDIRAVERLHHRAARSSQTQVCDPVCLHARLRWADPGAQQTAWPANAPVHAASRQPTGLAVTVSHGGSWPACFAQVLESVGQEVCCAAAAGEAAAGQAGGG